MVQAPSSRPLRVTVLDRYSKWIKTPVAMSWEDEIRSYYVQILEILKLKRVDAGFTAPVAIHFDEKSDCIPIVPLRSIQSSTAVLPYLRSKATFGDFPQKMNKHK